MNELFKTCVQILQWIADHTGTTYEEANIWIFVIIEPIVFILMAIWIIYLLRRIHCLKSGKSMKLPKITWDTMFNVVAWVTFGCILSAITLLMLIVFMVAPAGLCADCEPKVNSAYINFIGPQVDTLLIQHPILSALITGFIFLPLLVIPGLWLLDKLVGAISKVFH